MNPKTFNIGDKVVATEEAYRYAGHMETRRLEKSLGTVLSVSNGFPGIDKYVVEFVNDMGTSFYSRVCYPHEITLFQPRIVKLDLI